MHRWQLLTQVYAVPANAQVNRA